MTQSPRVTFLLSVRNCARTVGATIDSVLAQTMPDFELLVIDDVSTDATVEIVRNYRDPRIRLIVNPTHLNHSRSANLGLSLARAEFVARIDGDDLCLPQRAALQSDYLDAHPDVAILGACFETFSDLPNIPGGEIITPPLDSGSIAATLLFRNSIAQPAVMLRKSLLVRHGLEYDPLCIRAEDYELWARCAMHGLTFANLPDVLLRYRIHARQGVRLYAADCDETGRLTRRGLIQHLGLSPDSETLAIHEAIAQDQFSPTESFISSAARWLSTLANANDQLRRFDHAALMRLLTGRYVTLSRFAKTNRLPTPNIAASPFAAYLYPGVLV